MPNRRDFLTCSIVSLSVVGAGAGVFWKGTQVPGPWIVQLSPPTFQFFICIGQTKQFNCHTPKDAFLFNSWREAYEVSKNIIERDSRFRIVDLVFEEGEEPSHLLIEDMNGSQSKIIFWFVKNGFLSPNPIPTS